MLMLIDSGASNHCFTNQEAFSTYITLDLHQSGLSVGKNSTFAIVGRGNVDINCTVNEITRRITFEDVLHTPRL